MRSTAKTVTLLTAFILASAQADAAPSRAVWQGLCAQARALGMDFFFWEGPDGEVTAYDCGPGEVIEIEGEEPLCPPGCTWAKGGLPGCVCLEGDVPEPTGGGDEPLPGETDEPSQGAECAQCNHDAEQCVRKASQSTSACVDFWIDNFAREQCRQGFMIDGTKAPESEQCMTCSELLCGEDRSEAFCKGACPDRDEEICLNMVEMETCLDGWRYGMPDTKVERNLGISISPADLGVGVDAGLSITESYSAKTGIRSACLQWSNKAASACRDERNACLEEHQCSDTSPLVVEVTEGVSDQCPAFDPSNPDGNFCNDPNCPCQLGEGDCDRHEQCAPGLQCVGGQGPDFGLPEGWDVCLD